jgi:NAD(P)-dependent dehydrogenase (short-subunit alcohol dehydrogenase family)
MVKQLVPRMSEGSIIFNMTSGLGSFAKGIFDDGKTVYAISKTAISMLSAHQAANLAGRGIKVIVMDPGHVKTVSVEVDERDWRVADRWFLVGDGGPESCTRSACVDFGDVGGYREGAGR